jgi:ABC-type transport system substrate-binding protein
MSAMKKNQNRTCRHHLLVLAVLLPLLVWPTSTAHTASAPYPADPDAQADTDRVPISQPQGTLVRAITSEPNSLDLPQTAGMQAFTTAWQLYDSLVWADEDGTIMPALAKSWQVSQDGTEYTFALRQDVTFHNDEAFDADAVVFSWERARTGGFDGSAHWQAASSVEKTGSYTVTITTDEPDGLFLRTVADY